MEDNMAGILNKLMDFIGIEDVDDEGYNEDYFNDEQQSMAEDNVVSLGNRGRRKTAAGNNVVSLPTAAPMKMVVYHPVSYEDTQNIIDNLKMIQGNGYGLYMLDKELSARKYTQASPLATKA